MGEVILAVVQGQPMLYDQGDVVDATSQRHGLMQKNTLESINIDQ